MVGALIKISEENLETKIIKEMLKGKFNKKISYVAPACGLTLINIKY